MKSYLNYTESNFATDEDFIRWVKHRNEDDNFFWAQYLAENPTQKDTIEKAKAMVENLAFVFPSATYATQADRVWTRVNDTIKEESASEETPTLTVSWRRYWAVAASIVVLSVVGYQFFNATKTAQLLKVETVYGESKTVKLPDGSVVMLNGNSTIEYQADMEAQALRVVSLNGQAFFSVKHTQNNQKFVVKINEQTQVEVLGTEFEVTDRAEGVRIILKSGKVKVDFNDDGKNPSHLMMKPGDLLEINKKKIEKISVNADSYTSWTTGKLRLDNTPLSEIVKTLTHNYGLTVVVKDPQILSEKVSGTMPNPNVESLIKHIEIVFNVSAKLKGKEVTIERGF